MRTDGQEIALAAAQRMPGTRRAHGAGENAQEGTRVICSLAAVWRRDRDPHRLGARRRRYALRCAARLAATRPLSATIAPARSCSADARTRAGPRPLGATTRNGRPTNLTPDKPCRYLQDVRGTAAAAATAVTRTRRRGVLGGRGQLDCALRCRTRDAAKCKQRRRPNRFDRRHIPRRPQRRAPPQRVRGAHHTAAPGGDPQRHNRAASPTCTATAPVKSR